MISIHLSSNTTGSLCHLWLAALQIFVTIPKDDGQQKVPLST